MSFRRSLTLVASLLALYACGGASQKAVAPTGAAPNTIEDAQGDIDRASLEIAGAPATPAATGTSTAPSPSAPPPPPQPSLPPERPSETVTASASAECATKCRAIASMRRAVGVLCGLAGEEDARCVNARAKLAESEKRVAPCGC